MVNKWPRPSILTYMYLHNLHLPTFRSQAAIVRPSTIFFVKKPKILENVKSERAVANFQKKRIPRVSHNFQKFSDLGHKKHVCWINHYNEHDNTFLSDYNESEVN